MSIAVKLVWTRAYGAVTLKPTRFLDLKGLHCEVASGGGKARQRPPPAGSPMSRARAKWRRLVHAGTPSQGEDDAQPRENELS
jgi:hypothetical protein